LENPTVSVVIPAFNRSTLVTQAVDSVLAQTYTDYEIIVVDDGSTDDTKAALAQYGDRVRYIYQENRGASAARNAGVRNAKGRYIAFLDSDDLWLPAKLEKQVAVLEECPDVALVYSNISYCDDGGRRTRNAYRAHMFPTGYVPEEVLLWKAMCGHPPTWLIRRSCFDQIGYLDTSLAMSEDRDFSLRVAMKYKIHGIPEALTIVRQHTVTARLGRSAAADRERYYFQVLEKLFAERAGNPIVERNRKKLIAGYYCYAGKNYLREQDVATARKRFWLAICSDPFRAQAYVYLLAAVTGRKGWEALRAVRKVVLRRTE
jgi:glycosyltransferase involved in cell wall biosynthesis